MNTKYLQKETGNTRLMLVFAGWSTRPCDYEAMRHEGWDLLVVYDYDNFNLDLSFLNEYYTIYLFAWSLGVYVAEMTLPAERITQAFALNGTPQPVSDLYGIPANIYFGTAKGLDERNLKKFRLRMMPDKETFQRFFVDSNSANEDIESLRNQLYVISDTTEKDSEKFEGVQEKRNAARLPWVRAYLSKSDRIFPYDSMRRYWEGECETEIVSLEGTHYYPLELISRSVIPDTQKVSERFTKAWGSYDTHAIAQHSAAARLALMLSDYAPKKGGRILEIGCGSGLFTREYAAMLEPAEAIFIDIADCGPFGICENEIYVKGDAERWMEENAGKEKFDCILSASAIQWFSDMPRFLHNCSRMLSEGGIFAASTFTPGNMAELNDLRPSPLIYPKAESLREWLDRDFVDVAIEEDIIRVEFRSAREMLMHLKHTGVAGSAPGTGLPLSAMSHLRTLTYCPLYLLGRKQGNITAWRVTD